MQQFKRFFRFILNVQAAVIEGFQIREHEEEVEITIRRRTNAKPRCPKCRKVLSGEIRMHDRRWRHLDLIRTACYLRAEVREGYCQRHGRRVERVPWAFPGARFTKAFDYSVVDLVQVADKTAASRIFRTGWRTVGRMVERVVAKELPADRFANVTEIGIDETSYKRGHRYLTAVVNFSTGRVIWLGEGKSAATLGRFFEELGKERCKKLRMISMDMSGAFKKAIEEWVPHVDIVYDKFHVVKLLLEATDEVRREEVRGVEDEEGRKALKGTRFALLRNPKHRRPKDRDAIKLVAKKNRRLTRAYQLRVDIEELWKIRDPEKARAFLMRWTRSALLSRLEPFRRFARTVREHIEGIVGHFTWGRTNSRLEGINNKIKLAIHRAFGFHSLPALMAMVYLCCGGLDLSAPLGI